MSRCVSIAIPTLNAGPDFARTLDAVGTQRVDAEVQLLVCDSGSTDETLDRARAAGAEVIEIPRTSFSHGGTRNLLMERARGTHVAFLTQDAVPADPDWLAGLLAAFATVPNVGLAFGPYRPRPGASPSVVRELTTWFGSFSDGGARVDALAPSERDAPPSRFLGHLGFFTDANGCIARAAWERVPFRQVAYAEDHLLAQDMLRAGFAKVYVPDAAVIHSHEYSPWQWTRRSFDEARAVREVYQWTPDARAVARNLRGNITADWRWARAGRDGAGPPSPAGEIAMVGTSLIHNGGRAIGTLLGGRADRLPTALTSWLSLEGRG